MRSRSTRLLSSLVLISAMTGCYGAPVDSEVAAEGDDSNAPISCGAAGVSPVFADDPGDPDDHCDAVEQSRIRLAWTTVIRPQMCEAGPSAALARCVREARLSPSREAYAEEIIRRLRANLPTTIHCKSLPPGRNAQAPVGVSTESLTFDHEFLKADTDANTPGVQMNTPARVASVLLHEVAHNKGYVHYRETGEEYDHSVNEQVEICSRRVADGATPVPHGASRERNIAQETELQPFGDPGDSDGARFFSQCPAGTVLAGQQIGLNAVAVAGVRLWCRQPTTNDPPTPVGVGPDNSLGVQSMCAAGYVAVGVRARATDQLVRSVGFSCRRWSDVLAGAEPALADLPLPPNAPLPAPLSFNDNTLRRTCPRGMYITALAGSLDGSMEQLRVWCGRPSFGAGGAWNTTIDNVTFDPGSSSSRRSHEERCAENGAINGLFGSTRGGAVVRMGAYCRGLQRTAQGGYTLLGEHLLSTGGDGPTSDTFEARCGAGQVARGFEARPAPTGRGVGGLRLLCGTMSPNSPLTPVLVAGAWSTTGVQSRVCPPGQRLVGLRASSAEYGLPIPVGRVVDRLAPVCRAFVGS